MSCKHCGAQTTRRHCRSCELKLRHGDGLDDYEWAECPTCGGTTSGEGVVCYRCRGDDDRDEAVTDGGRDRLESALDLTITAAEAATDVDDVLAAHLKLAECGVREAFYTDSDAVRELVLEDAEIHFEAAADQSPTDDVGVPTRNAWQLVAAVTGGDRA